MNQILYVGDNKNNGPVAVKSVIKFFAIVIIIFGIILIGEGTYSMYKGIVANSGNNIPTVYMNRVNDTVVIKAENNIEIAKLIYSWNKGEETVLLPNNKAVEEVVLLPNENSILNVTIVDIKGKETKFMQQWNIEGIDIKKPEMEIATDDSSRKITIIARDETQIDYLIYKWNNEAETRVNGTERNKLEIQKTIDMKLGENKLTVTAVDKNGNTNTLEKTIIISSKPTIAVKQSNSKIHIVINDEVSIKTVSININGQVYAGEYEAKKQLKLNVPLKQGNNTVSITVTNESGLEQKVVREFIYKP
ncbi:MAG: hypothetical protein ACLUF5_05370 [Clostridia bacterium]|nr:unknown [Clostridium sp. CAG:798]HBJ11743.1 hypothetical protein [Clostridiales bacterium]